MGEGRYRKVIIVNGVEHTNTRTLSRTINGVTRPMNECEIEKEIANEIKEAKNAHVELKKEAAEKLIDEIIKLRRSELKENSSNESIVSMTFGDLAKSKGIDLNKFKKDKNKVAINVVRKSIEDLQEEKIAKNAKSAKSEKKEIMTIVIIYIILMIILYFIWVMFPKISDFFKLLYLKVVNI